MPATQEREESWLAGLPEWGPEWLRDLRRAAAERFTALGFPTTRDEEWRFTSVAPIARAQFRRAAAGDERRAAELMASLPRDGYCLVFVNGRYSRALSDHAIEHGLTLSHLAAQSKDLPYELARSARFEEQAFVALNTASFEDGAYIRIPDGIVMQRPVHIVHVSTGEGVSHPRILFVCGAGSHASLIESYLGEGRYFTNAVSEIVCGGDSVVDHVKLQQESADAFHIATVQVDQARGSSFTSHSLTFGARLTRNDINARLATGAECALNGLYLTDGARHVDNHTAIDHAEPHASSRELYKGILDGQSSAVFNGKVIVRPDAQKTDAKQTNKNLVLSEDATINTKPELQIHADDVRCTHGATVGQLDREAVFYLRSRGIDLATAREILTHAFASEVVDGVRHEPLRAYVEGLLI
jgi:Fe-S cluster assembly protein SufD